MAYDLSRQGYWAIDIGQIDIEYEWFLKDAKKKEAIRGKYVNEAGGMDTFVEFDPEIISNYEEQIIAQII